MSGYAGAGKHACEPKFSVNRVSQRGKSRSILRAIGHRNSSLFVDRPNRGNDRPNQNQEAFQIRDQGPLIGGLIVCPGERQEQYYLWIRDQEVLKRLIQKR
jgi:hypothetical protein